jgi:abortive infection bacteriophage resistance protein
MKNGKRFFTYEEQIELHISDEEFAISQLKKYSYYSLVSGYKDIFKEERNGKYLNGTDFNQIVNLYNFDNYIRYFILQEIINVEKHIKSLYSYHFCKMYGDQQSDYLNMINYNITQYSDKVIKFISMVTDTLSHADRYSYVNYNMQRYGTVPLWVIINTFTFGNISKMFQFSKQELQSQISREFKDIYPHQLISILDMMTKFRNVCAHGERLYNYKTHNSVRRLPIHSQFSECNRGKNDLFNLILSLKYLIDKENFQSLLTSISGMIDMLFKEIGKEFGNLIVKEMGFPVNWKDLFNL